MASEVYELDDLTTPVKLAAKENTLRPRWAHRPISLRSLPRCISSRKQTNHSRNLPGQKRLNPLGLGSACSNAPSSHHDAATGGGAAGAATPPSSSTVSYAVGSLDSAGLSWLLSRQAHPCSRGEHSPPATGASRRPRLIPAHAGSTVPRDPYCRRSGAHPRSRGEHLSIKCVGLRSGGSSPLTRGAQAVGAQVGDAHRLIPAHAGSTPSWG